MSSIKLTSVSQTFFCVCVRARVLVCLHACACVCMCLRVAILHESDAAGLLLAAEMDVQGQWRVERQKKYSK